MPIFQFQAKMPGGKTVKGELDAPSEVEARVKLRSQHLIPVRIIAKGTKKQNSATGDFFAQKVSSKDLQVFTRQFATMVNSGIPIVQGVTILADGSQNLTLKKVLQQVKDSITSGKRLAESMKSHPRIYNDMYVNMVRAGEEGGVLDVILERLAQYIEKSENIKNKVKGALFYPVTILFIAGIVITVVMVMVVPKFEELFASTGRDLPELTKMVIAMSDFFVHQWYILLGLLMLSFFGIKSYYATSPGRYMFDGLLINMPVFGPVVQKSEIARFSRTLGTLLSSGITLMEALDIASDTVSNAHIQKTLKECMQVIQQGKSIVGPLSTNPLIPDMVVQMIGVGEQTGAMDVMLDKIADFYESEVDYAVTAATSMIEPIMMVILGVIIAFLVVAMYLPVFDMAGGF